MGELSKHEDEWQRRATAAAIAAARGIVLGDGAVINKNAPVGRLSDTEWGWIVCGAIFAWIATRSEQATSEGLDVERTIRMSIIDPCPWDAGAIATILPKLAECHIDWSTPLAEWSRKTMIAFLLIVLDLIREATIARDLGGGAITRKADTVLNDEIPPL